MKGVILAAGQGTRLHPLTKVTSKHLLPVGNVPMIVHSIHQFLTAGITDILIVTNPRHAGDFIKFLGSGKKFRCDLTYRVQEEQKGIAHALAVAERFAEGSKIAVLLADNIFERPIAYAIDDFREQRHGARVMLKHVPWELATQVAIAQRNEENIVAIEEKPKIPKSDLAVIGAYCYDENVFDIIRQILPCPRTGEYEMAAVNNAYIGRGQLEYTLVQGAWLDAGTFESLHEAHRLVINAAEKLESGLDALQSLTFSAHN